MKRLKSESKVREWVSSRVGGGGDCGGSAAGTSAFASGSAASPSRACTFRFDQREKKSSAAIAASTELLFRRHRRRVAKAILQPLQALRTGTLARLGHVMRLREFTQPLDHVG